MFRAASLCTLAAFVIACGGGDDTDTDTDTDVDRDTDTDTDTDTEAGPCVPSEAALASQTGFPTSTPPLTWAPPQGDCADGYEIAVGSAAGGTDVLDWTTISGTDAWDGRGLPEQLPLQGTLHLSLRATTASGAGEAVDAGTFSVWTPKELDRVVLWLDPTDPAVAYADNRCSTAATVDQPVRCIVDKSGGPHTFIHDGEGAPYKAPVLRELAPGRAVDFRDDGILYTPSTSWLSFSDAGLVFALVDRPDVIDATRGTPYHYPLNKEGAYEFAYGEGDLRSAIETTAPGLWEWTGPGTQAATTTLQQHTVVYDGTDMTFRRNGSALGTVPSGGRQTGAIDGEGRFTDPRTGREVRPTPVVLGGRPLDLTFSYEADLAELVLVAGTIEAEELADLERYLLERWDL